MISVNQQNFSINLITYIVTDIYSKCPTENGFAGQDIAIESEGSLFKCHLVLCQA